MAADVRTKFAAQQLESASRSLTDLLRLVINGYQDFADIRDSVKRLEFCLILIAAIVTVLAAVLFTVAGIYFCRIFCYNGDDRGRFILTPTTRRRVQNHGEKSRSNHRSSPQQKLPVVRREVVVPIEEPPIASKEPLPQSPEQARESTKLIEAMQISLAETV